MYDGRMRLALFPVLSLLLCVQAIAQSVQPTQPTKVRVRGIELHYIQQGHGEPLILLHGGTCDYRSLEPQMTEQAIIPKAGHGSPRENPKAFNEAVLKIFG